MTEKNIVEYRVREIPRYVVTRYTETDHGNGKSDASCETRGEYDNPDVAHEVAYALCKREHDALGWPAGDERITYPSKDNTGPFENDYGTPS